MKNILKHTILQRGLILLKAILPSRGLASPKQVSSIQGSVHWDEEDGKQCRCFLEPLKLSEVWDVGKYKFRKKAMRGSCQVWQCPLTRDRTWKLSFLSYKRTHANWADLRQRITSLSWLNQRSASCLFIPFSKEEEEEGGIFQASHLPAKLLDSNFVSLNDAKQTNLAISSALLLQAALCKIMPNHSKNQLVCNTEYSCLMELNLAS